MSGLPQVQNVLLPGAVPACHARPDAGQPVRGAVVVLMEAYGLTPHIRGICARLAQAGYVSVAPDFHRGKIYSYDDRPAILKLLGGLDDEALMRDVDAALDFIRAQDGVTADRIAVLGYCMGGRLAFIAGSRHAERLRAVVSFYGGGIAPEGEDRFGRRVPLLDAGKICAPLLLVYGADDAGIAAAEHARVAAKLSELKKRYALSVYPGAAHGFCCEDRAAYAPRAAAQSFAEMTDFLARSMPLG
ncbi:MAG: dienelactone hydrolase family protein [Stenotrophobium sp.]